MTFKSLVAKAVKIAGSQQKLADALGCSQQHISYLLNDAQEITAEFALRMEKATGGKVSRHELRPDIFGAAKQRASA